MTLEDKLYCLSHTNLPDDLFNKYEEAQQLFDKDHIYLATLRVYQLIDSCRKRDISFYTPEYFVLQ